MIVAARPASPEDVPVLASLTAAARAEALTKRRGDLLVAADLGSSSDLQSALGAVDQNVVVGEIDGVVVGYGLASIDRLEDGRLLARVRELFVDEEGREVGVGEALIESIVNWAVTQRAVGIDALALPGDRATKNFFETCGLTARLIVVHRPLGDKEAWQ